MKTTFVRDPEHAAEAAQPVLALAPGVARVARVAGVASVDRVPVVAGVAEVAAVPESQHSVEGVRLGVSLCSNLQQPHCSTRQADLQWGW